VISLPGIPLIPFVPKNLRVTVDNLGTIESWYFLALINSPNVISLVWICRRKIVALTPEPALVLARELSSADVASDVARLDEYHFVIAKRADRRLFHVSLRLDFRLISTVRE